MKSIKNDIKPTICISMIVKDEQDVILKCLNNIESIIKPDYWVICDTGSSDNTINIVNSFLKDKQGELVQHKWYNFAKNRNLSLDIAKTKADYTLFADADDIFVGILNKKDIDADTICLNFKREGSSMLWHRPMLISNNKKWYWESEIHEYITTSEEVSTKFINSLYVSCGYEGARQKNPNKYKDDAKNLMKYYNKELKENNKPHLLPRYSFYIAQSFKDSGDFNKAIKWYIERLKYEGWIQEKYIACMILGDLHLKKSNENDTNTERLENKFLAETYYKKALDFNLNRAEVYYRLCILYRGENNFTMAYIMAKEGKNLKIQPDSLFTETEVYVYLLDYELSILLFYVNKIKEGLNLCNDLLKKLDKLGFKENQIYSTTEANLDIYKNLYYKK